MGNITGVFWKPNSWSGYRIPLSSIGVRNGDVGLTLGVPAFAGAERGNGPVWDPDHGEEVGSLTKVMCLNMPFFLLFSIAWYHRIT
jgi:hypothetical protein